MLALVNAGIAGENPKRGGKRLPQILRFQLRQQRSVAAFSMHELFYVESMRRV